MPYQYRESGPSCSATELGVQSIIAGECTRAPYPSGLIAEFQWWLLLVGLVAGGGLVAVVSMDGKRREVDIEALERRAEAGWIAERLAASARWIDSPTVESVLRLHREYLGLPPPDAILVDGEDTSAAASPAADDGRDSMLGWLDRDADGVSDEIRDDRRGGADQDLARPGEEQAAAGQQAHAGADREQRPDR